MCRNSLVAQRQPRHSKPDPSSEVPARSAGLEGSAEAAPQVSKRHHIGRASTPRVRLVSFRTTPPRPIPDGRARKRLATPAAHGITPALVRGKQVSDEPDRRSS